MVILLKKMYLYMVHNMVYVKQIIIKLECYQSLFLIKLRCLDFIHVYSGFLISKEQLQGLFY
jgi:hypothetical protein